MYANSDEPLARQVQMAANNKQRRRRSMPIGGGIASSVGLPDSLAAQADMDAMQSSEVSSPVRRGPMRLASMQPGSGADGGGAIMTTGFRRSGGTVIPTQNQTCAPGSDCARRQGQGLGMTNGYNLPAAPQPAGPVPMDAQGLMDYGARTLQSAEAMGSGAQATLGQSAFQAGLNMAMQAPSDAIAQKYLEQHALNADLERRTQEHNLKAGREATVEGHNDTIMKIVHGVGDYKKLDAETRGRQAAEEAARVYPGVEVTGKPFDYEATQKFFQAKAAGADIAGLIAGSGAAVKDEKGIVRWRGGMEDGNSLASVASHLAASAYTGRKNPETKKVMYGTELKTLMHSELDTPIAYGIEQKLRSAFPDLDEGQTRRIALQEAHEMVGRLWRLPHEANLANSPPSGYWNWQWWVNNKLDAEAKGAAAPAPQQRPVQSIGEDSTRMLD